MSKQLFVGLIVVFGMHLALGAAVPEATPGSPERRAVVDLAEITPARAEAARGLAALCDNKSGQVRPARPVTRAERLKQYRISITALKNHSDDKLGDGTRAIYRIGDRSPENREVLAMINERVNQVAEAKK